MLTLLSQILTPMSRMLTLLSQTLAPMSRMLTPLPRRQNIVLHIKKIMLKAGLPPERRSGEDGDPMIFSPPFFFSWVCEPVWLIGLWTLSCHFVPHNYETLKCLSLLPILMQKSFWWRQCSDRYNYNLPQPPPTYHPLLLVPNKPYGFCGR